MNLKGNLTSKGLQGSIGKSRMQGILGTNPAAIPITVDNALSLSSTNPVQNRVITAAITNRLWSDEVKTALLQIVEKVAFIDEHGQDYYDALYDALYPPTNLDSIGAVFDSSATIYNTDTLDDLKQYLTVTAYYTDGTSETVTTYTLSGSMDAGTQTITVSYGGKTTTFTVTVVEWLVSIDAVFTQGSATIYDTDSLDTLKQYLVVTATYADSTTAVVSDYTLSGTLEAGTSTITVSYGGKTDAFTVSVTSHVLYLVENQSVSAGDMFKSGVNYLAANFAGTILLDYTISSLPTSGNGSTIGAIAIWSNVLNNWGIRIGKATASSSAINGRWMGLNNEAMGFDSFAANTRHRFAVLHEANSPTITVYHKKGTGTIKTWSKTASEFTPIVTNADGVLFGSQENGASSLCAGTVSKAEVCYGILPQSELNAFFE